MAKLTYAASTRADDPPVFYDYAGIWRATEKVVHSRTLQTASSARTRIERELDPDAIRQLKESSGTDIAIGGAELAGHAIGAGLVDECHLFLFPVVAGGGKRALPDDVRVRLEHLDERRFRNSVAPPLPRIRLTGRAMRRQAKTRTRVNGC